MSLTTTLPQLFVVRKQTDQSVTEATDFVVDDDLYHIVEPHGFYKFETFIICEGDSNADIQFKFTGPTGSDIYWAGNLTDTVEDSVFSGTINTRLLSNQSLHSSIPGRINGTGIENSVAYCPHGYVYVGDTVGTFALEWAPLASSITAVTVKANSVLILTRLT